MKRLVKVTDVSVQFGGLKALNNVNLDLFQGEIVGLIGPNGAGKSTLFNTVMGLIKPSTGEIYLEDHRIDGRRPHFITKLGMTKTFQNVSLFPDMDVLDNVMVAALSHADMDAARVVATEALERLGLSAIAHCAIDDLTFPQRALVEVARAIATNAKVILLDEVMAALNHSEMDQVIQVLESLREEGMTLFVVEHHMKAIMRLCNRIVVLNFGAVIASGTPEEVVNNPKVVEAYLGSTAKEVQC